MRPYACILYPVLVAVKDVTSHEMFHGRNVGKQKELWTLIAQSCRRFREIFGRILDQRRSPVVSCQSSCPFRKTEIFNVFAKTKLEPRSNRPRAVSLCSSKLIKEHTRTIVCLHHRKPEIFGGTVGKFRIQESARFIGSLLRDGDVNPRTETREMIMKKKGKEEETQRGKTTRGGRQASPSLSLSLSFSLRSSHM